MRGKTLLLSIALHGLLALLVLFFANRKQPPRPIQVAVVEARKKKQPEKPPEPEKPAEAKPPPPPRPAAVALPAPAVVEAPAPAPTPAPAPKGPRISTGLTLQGGPSAGGMAVGGLTRERVDPRPAPRSPSRVDAPAREQPCLEEPTKPTLVRSTEIEYPPRAREEGVEGRLVLRVLLGEDGTVRDVEVLSSVEPSLDAAAIATVRTWIFKPSMRCGKPYAGGTYTLARRFELGD